MRRRGIERFALRNAERRLAVFGSMSLLGLPVQRVALQEWVVFLFFQTVWRVRAFLVPRRDVTRRGFALGFRLGAFECDDIAGHDDLFLGFCGRFLFVAVAAFFIR